MDIGGKENIRIMWKRPKFWYGKFIVIVPTLSTAPIGLGRRIWINDNVPNDRDFLN